MKAKSETITNDIGNMKHLLPDGWKWVRLGDVCSFENGDRGINYPSRSKRTTQGVPFINAGHLTDYGIDSDNLDYISRDRFDLLGGGKIRGGDILFCLRGSLGKSAYVDNLSEGAIASSLVIVRPSSSIMNKYLIAYFKSPLCTEMIYLFRSGAAQPNLSVGSLSKFIIPLPPLPEQKRIAAILNEQMTAVEKARAAAEKQLEAAKALPAAYLRQMFPRNGQELPPGWRRVRLGNVCKVIGGSTPDTGNPAYWDGDVTWITPTDLGKLNSRYITTSARKITASGYKNCGTELLPAGSVVMSSRAPIGHLGIANVSLCTNQGCKNFVPTQTVDTEFLYWLLKKSVPKLQLLGSGATFTEVSKSALQEFTVPFPPLPEQRRIAAILNEQMAAVEKLKTELDAQLDEINALPNTLLRKAFKGEL